MLRQAKDPTHGVNVQHGHWCGFIISSLGQALAAASSIETLNIETHAFHDRVDAITVPKLNTDNYH